MKPGIKHSFSLEKRYHEPLSVTTLPMRSMEWRDSVDSMEINGFPWISMEFMDSMESMDSMDAMESVGSMESNAFLKCREHTPSVH